MLDLNTTRGSVQYDIGVNDKFHGLVGLVSSLVRAFVRRRKTRVLARRTGRLSASVFADCAPPPLWQINAASSSINATFERWLMVKKLVAARILLKQSRFPFLIDVSVSAAFNELVVEPLYDLDPIEELCNQGENPKQNHHCHASRAQPKPIGVSSSL